jgi:hypothetical protein
MRINYHNSNQAKKKDKNKSFTNVIDVINNPLMLKNQNEKEVNFWEPFIEPLPAKFTSLSSDENQYIKFEILSLTPAYDGLKGFYRQSKFHSLNINLNERLMENVKYLLQDYEKTKALVVINKKNSSDNVIDTQKDAMKHRANVNAVRSAEEKLNRQKTLTIMNLIGLEMKIELNDNMREIYVKEVKDGYGERGLMMILIAYYQMLLLLMKKIKIHRDNRIMYHVPLLKMEMKGCIRKYFIFNIKL